jgi:hypothetical protein
MGCTLTSKAVYWTFNGVLRILLRKRRVYSFGEGTTIFHESENGLPSPIENLEVYLREL